MLLRSKWILYRGLIVMGVCTFFLQKIHDTLLKHNWIQYVEEERVNKRTGRLEPYKLYPPGFDPKNQDHWDELVKKEYTE